uniref:Uncharacterized protein n=1 Tax=Amphimedon queenslandica TaxID=400682 RepID=A0A1X7VBZ1_AMPQE
MPSVCLDIRMLFQDQSALLCLCSLLPSKSRHIHQIFARSRSVYLPCARLWP